MALFKPGNWDVRQRELSVALRLCDRFTRQSIVLGQVQVRVAGQPEQPPFQPRQKEPEATFLFFELPPGPLTLQVRSHERTPYYQAVDIPLLLPHPHPRWRTFPDRELADPQLLLDDPQQTAAFRAQYLQAALRPTVAYPFPPDATLVRGTVNANGTPLAEAVVSLVNVSDWPDQRPRRDRDLQYRTGSTGEFVLFFPEVFGVTEAFRLRATHPDHPTIEQVVTVHAARTTSTTLVLA